MTIITFLIIGIFLVLLFGASAVKRGSANFIGIVGLIVLIVFAIGFVRQITSEQWAWFAAISSVIALATFAFWLYLKKDDARAAQVLAKHTAVQKRLQKTLSLHAEVEQMGSAGKASLLQIVLLLGERISETERDRAFVEAKKGLSELEAYVRYLCTMHQLNLENIGNVFFATDENGDRFSPNLQET